MGAFPFQVIDGGTDLIDYPVDPRERLDSHFFVVWQHRRWLNSDMRMKGAPECRALYFDLINLSHEQTPIGTLPNDVDVLAKMVHTDRDRFAQMCDLPYGPLHNWQPCRVGDQVRLMHEMVLQSVLDAISSREDNRARNEAGNAAKRRQRLRGVLANLQADLAKNDHAVQWIDDWLVEQGCHYRTAIWIERAMTAWSQHMVSLHGGRSNRLR